jgi:hypothetical protein
MHTVTKYHETVDLFLYSKNIFKMYIWCVKVESNAIGPKTF